MDFQSSNYDTLRHSPFPAEACTGYVVWSLNVSTHIALLGSGQAEQTIGTEGLHLHRAQVAMSLHGHLFLCYTGAMAWGNLG